MEKVNLPYLKNMTKFLLDLFQDREGKKITSIFEFKYDTSSNYRAKTFLNRIIINTHQLEIEKNNLGYNVYLGSIIYTIIHELYHLYQFKGGKKTSKEIEFEAASKAEIFINRNYIQLQRKYISAKYHVYNYKDSLEWCKKYSYITNNDVDNELKVFFKKILDLPFELFIKPDMSMTDKYDIAYKLYSEKENNK